MARTEMAQHEGDAHVTTQVVAGVRFAVMTAPSAVQALPGMVQRTKAGGKHLHFANAYSLALADQDPMLRATFNDEDAMCLPDGKPVAWASRLFRQSPRLMQVRGPGFFRDALRASSDGVLGHYLIGGSPETLASLVARIREEAAGIRLVGSESPPFRELTADEQREQVARVRDSGADVVWLGLGTPKQDFEAARLARELPVVAIAIGAAFDFYAGTAPEAPNWMQRAGLEWLFRFVSEPRRLWRRYSLGSLRFIWATARHAGAGR